MSQNRYRMDISVRLAPVEENGYPTGGQLEIREDVTIEADNFLEVAGILGKFHDLAEVLQKLKTT